MHGVVEERANAARVYDYMLGRAHNLGSDRDTARALLADFPWLQRIAWENRGFLVRAVRFCLDQGIDQFLDLGSGVPTVGNVHEIACARRPGGAHRLRRHRAGRGGARPGAARRRRPA